MTKEIVSCTALNTMSLATAERCFQILLSGSERRYGIRIEDVQVRERRPGETGFYIDSRPENRRVAP